MDARQRASLGWFATGFLLLVGAGLGVAMLAAPQALRELRVQEQQGGTVPFAEGAESGVR
jgi:hypothetical protein